MAITTRGLLNTTALTNVGFAAGLAMATGSAMALPQNGQVVGGQAMITQPSANQLTIDQTSSNAVINWQSFSIGKNQTTTFEQPTSSSIAFNRVTGVDASIIQGSLKANGQVVLVNPNGMLFTNTAKVNVGGLVASTAGITNANAMAGNLVFDQAGPANAKITNAGSITAAEGGLVALVSPNVANSGVITAKLGKVALAAGDKWTLDLYGDKLVQFAVDDQTAGKIDQSGIINANNNSAGGYAVQLTANDAKGVVSNVINMSGVINATSVTNDGGDILLEGGSNGTLVTGQIASNGGKIVVSGADVKLEGGTINATGTAGGGTVDIGTGDGVLANSVFVGSKTSVTSNGGINGNGGSINIKSSGNTRVAGQLTSQGGTKGGNGGQILTDGNTLNVDGATVDTSAPAGNIGDWNIVETNVDIDKGMASSIDKALANGNVDVASGEGQANKITVSSNIHWNSDNTLTLESYRNIAVDAAIKDSGDGNIVLRADDEGTDHGSVTFSGTGTAQTKGVVGIYYDPINGYTHPVTYTAAQAHGDKGTTAYMLVNNMADLEKVNDNLHGTYALGKVIDASTVAAGTYGPIGSSSKAFTGLFDGFGGIETYSIDNFYFHGDNASNLTDVGIFANNAGTIRRVDAKNVDIAGLVNTGGLVGYNSGRLVDDSVTGQVHGFHTQDASSTNTGGLVGFNAASGLVKNDKFTGTVFVDDNSINAGGFVGVNKGVILGSKFAGTVTANNGSSDVGGFVGQNNGNGLISGSTATGTVYIGGNSSAVGGFAGSSLGADSTIENSHANDKLNVGDNDINVGGFVGRNAGTMVGDFASTLGMAFGSNDTNVGGFAGDNSGGIYGVLALGSLTGVDHDTNIGGLVGYNIGTINNSGAIGDVTLGDYSKNVGGFAGYNNGALNLDTVGGNYTGHATITGSACDCTVTPAAASPASAVTVGKYGTNIGGYVGYDASGTLSNVTVANSVRAGLGSQNVGGLIGQNHATLLNDTVKANVYSAQYSGSVGGMVGLNYGRIDNAGVTGAVIVGGSTDFGGGVIGANYGDVTNSDFSQGSVLAGCDQIGGFVGGNFGTISTSNFTGLVENGGGYQTGGFAGQNTGTLASDSVVDGDVKLCSVTQGGGFVGYNSGKITDGTATVTLTNSANVTDQGGFAGKNDGTITGSTTDADVTIGSASNYVGGFVGVNSGFLTNDKSTGSVHVGDNMQGVGGFAGRNDRSITNSSSNTDVHSTDFETNVGGYVGVNNGTVTNGVETGLVYVGDNAMNVAVFAGLNSSTGTITQGFGNSNGRIGNNAVNVGGLVGQNDGLVKESGDNGFSGNLNVGSGATAVGGLVGYNIGRVNGGYASGPMVVGENAFYVGGDIGWNDAGGTVSGVSHDGLVKVGNFATGVGGVAGLNGSDATNGRGNFGTAAAKITNSFSQGRVAVGTDSFAIGGIVGWDSAWTANNSMSGTVYFGEVSDGHDTVLKGNNVTSQGVVYGGDGTTYIHDKNQVGCDERAGGNCFGIAGQEIITINAEPDADSAGDTLYTLTGMAPGNPNEIALGNVLESYDHKGNIIIGQYTATPDPSNPGFFIISGGPGLNPKNRNANLDYLVKVNVPAPTTPVPVTPTTPTTTGAVTPITPQGTLTPIAAASQGNLTPLISATALRALNQASQIDCLKVNLEVLGVQTDSPIDCSQPLQVNGF